jgi:hypothetical protein
MNRTWEGEAKLRIYATGVSSPVRVQVHTNPARIPGLTYPTWSGKFSVEPFTPFTAGRGVMIFPNGAEADVMVEGFDVVTGEGYFFGAGVLPL